MKAVLAAMKIHDRRPELSTFCVGLADVNQRRPPSLSDFTGGLERAIGTATSLEKHWPGA
jgi:hypothetical protein